MVRVALCLAALCAAACGPSSASPAAAPVSTGAGSAAAPGGADVARICESGEDVPALETHLAPGKVTIFDFYADWCAPCKKIDAHVNALMRRRSDLAVRKLNVVSWETPIAARHLKNVEELPYLIIYGADGALVGRIVGLDLAALDRAIAEGAR